MYVNNSNLFQFLAVYFFFFLIYVTLPLSTHLLSILVHERLILFEPGPQLRHLPIGLF